MAGKRQVPDFTISSHVEGDCAFVHVSGAGSLDGLKGLVDYVDAFCVRHNLDKALIDMLSVDYDPNIMERFITGLYAARKLKQKVSVAVLYQKDKIDKVVENTAVNRGADVLITASEREARRWLKG